MNFFASPEIDIRFSLAHFSANEGDGEIEIALSVVGRHATDVSVRVTALNYDDFISRGFVVGTNFTALPDQNPKSPNRANGV